MKITQVDQLTPVTWQTTPRTTLSEISIADYEVPGRTLTPIALMRHNKKTETRVSASLWTLAEIGCKPRLKKAADKLIFSNDEW